MTIEISPGKNWQFEGMDEKWEKEIKGGLRWLKKSPVAGLSVGLVEASSRSLWIVPMTGDHRQSNSCNATTMTRAKSWKAEDDAHPSGKTYHLGKTDINYTREDERKEMSTSKGTGKGGDTEISFSASNLGYGACASNVGNWEPGPGDSPDEVMCHELVHALRRMQGVFDPAPTTNSNYKNEEEWLAVVVTNLFISSKGGTQFRGEYLVPGSTLKPPLDSSDGFLTDAENLSLAKKYLANWRDVIVNLARATPSPFNPFRELVDHPKKY